MLNEKPAGLASGKKGHAARKVLLLMSAGLLAAGGLLLAERSFQAPPADLAASGDGVAPPVEPAPGTGEEGAETPPSDPPVVARLADGCTDEDVFHIGLFYEPLVPVGGKASEQERKDFQETINAFSLSQSLELLDGFLERWPESRWRAGLEYQLGTRRYEGGYFTPALAHWQKAWELSKEGREDKVHAFADQAYARLLHLNSALGRMEVLEPLLQAEKERTFLGSAWPRVQAAEGALGEMKNRPDFCFKCGPYALANVREALGMKEPLAPAITEAKSGPEGFSLSQVSGLADQLGMASRMAKMETGAELPVPSVVHWKLGHYAAIVDQKEGNYLVRDPTFGFENWISADAIRQETSGYFLVASEALPPGFREVGAAEGNGVYGRGLTTVQQKNQTSPSDKQCPDGTCPDGMAIATVHAMMVSLHVEDTPLGYEPPFGLPINLNVFSNELESFQPGNTPNTSFGPKWSSNWSTAYIHTPGNSKASVYPPGGGAEEYPNYSDPNYRDPKSQASLAYSQDASGLRQLKRNLPDSTQEVYEEKVLNSGMYFLVRITDPQGNATTLEYTGTTTPLLSRIVDGPGRATTFSYEASQQPPGCPNYVTKVTDPFGRAARFYYDASGRLASIKDVIGITSSFGYDGVGNVIASLTTPYGTTAFARGNGYYANERWIETTDPLGGKERVEFRSGAISDNGSKNPASMVIVNGQEVNFLVDSFYLTHRNSFYWDKKKMLDGGVKADGTMDYRKADLYHWLHTSNGQTSSILESIKRPGDPEKNPQGENRICYNYPGQTEAQFASNVTVAKPSKIAQRIEDESTQLSQTEYNVLGLPLKKVDPLGRTTLYTYWNAARTADDPNGRDLHHVKQVTAAGPGNEDIVAAYNWNSKHRPTTIKGMDGKAYTYTWNSRSQIASLTDPLNQVTTYTYGAGANGSASPDGYLVSVDPPFPGTSDQITFTYDASGRVASRSQWGYTLNYQYDALDRLTRTTYPDGTYELLTYGSITQPGALDVVQERDRNGEITKYAWDANRHLTKVTDPLNRDTQYEWCLCGRMTKLTDPRSRVTQWDHDLQGREISKTYADGTVWTQSYTPARGLLASRTDALNQVKTYAYALDNRLTGVSYSNAVAATPPVGWTWDAYYPRPTQMTDATGATTFTYKTAGFLGGGQINAINGPWSSDTLSFTYDLLGRVATRSLNGSANQNTWTRDELGRVTSVQTPLAHPSGSNTFTYSYNSANGRLAQVE
ncbi:MAG TPA: cysteine peptidase family C39 domain-containing protein, partial [Chthoniobacterales bacterium]